MMSRDVQTVPRPGDAYPEGMASDAPRPGSGEASARNDADPQASDELRDAALHEEIELVGQLVVAATSTPHRLSQSEIDRVLGVGQQH
jgi:hypothetical protein